MFIKWLCGRGTAITGVHQVHLMNAEHRQAAVDPRTKAEMDMA